MTWRVAAGTNPRARNNSIALKSLPRIAFVIQRYGRGGAEFLCQSLAEHLSARYDTTVITTCAIDNHTWANHFPPGETAENGVRVIRFPVTRERDAQFGELTESILFAGGRSREDELGWLAAQGPRSPALLDYLDSHRTTYDVFFFVTYLYEHTVLGLPLVADRAVFIPTAHDEPEIQLGIFREVFAAPRYFIFMTHAERAFVHATFRNQHIPGRVVSLGMNPIPKVATTAFRRRYGIEGELLLSIGRIESAKGIDELVEFVRALPADRSRTLVLIGQNLMGLAREDGILPLGHVSNQQKHEALAAADVFIMPSAHESLSIVTLEAWQHGKPVLATARSQVVLDHVRASQGGLYYDGRLDFAAALNHLRENPDLCVQMGANGRRYVETNFTWDLVDRAYDDVIRAVVDRALIP